MTQKFTQNLGFMVEPHISARIIETCDSHFENGPDNYATGEGRDGNPFIVKKQAGALRHQRMAIASAASMAKPSRLGVPVFQSLIFRKPLPAGNRHSVTVFQSAHQ
jgi:hypothetical protein